MVGRRPKNIAKEQIFDVFRASVESGQAKVTISATVEAAGMNRKTFYNHFSSKEELAAWGFRHDLYQVICANHEIVADDETISGDSKAVRLLYSPSDPYDFDGLPCYFRVAKGTISLDQSSYFYDFYDVFRIYKSYYRALMRSDIEMPFCRYLTDLLQGLFYEDLDYFLNGRKMPEEAKGYIAAFYAEGVVHHAVSSLLGSVSHRREIEGISVVSNLVHESMLQIVEAYQKERSFNYFHSTRY